MYFTYNGVNEGECDFTTLRKDTCITKVEQEEEEELETKLAEVGIYQWHPYNTSSRAEDSSKGTTTLVYFLNIN